MDQSYTHSTVVLRCEKSNRDTREDIPLFGNGECPLSYVNSNYSSIPIGFFVYYNKLKIQY